MPKNCATDDLSPAERRREIASILSCGVVRWRRRVKAPGVIDAQKPTNSGEYRLELSRETRLSVFDATRGFTPRDDGVDA